MFKPTTRADQFISNFMTSIRFLLIRSGSLATAEAERVKRWAHVDVSDDRPHEYSAF